jgi:Protein of unknown function (DUF3617)
MIPKSALKAIALVMAQPATLYGAEFAPLQSGGYEVAVTLQLPHLDDPAARKLATICVNLHDAAPYGFKVLSDNNPFGKCAATNSRLVGKTLTFDIICEGPNAAHAAATYAFDRQTFEGQIAMQMSGKNMTMTEIQSGRRTGDCLAPGSTRP